jgi:hypothetical protein
MGILFGTSIIPGHDWAATKSEKMVWHRSHIVRDDDHVACRAEFEDLRVLHLLGNHVLRQLEINLRLSQQKARHDLLIEIGVG